MRERYDNWTDGDGGDDSGFWNDEPTSRLERITQSIPRITQALPKLGQAFHRHHDEWDFRAEEPPAAPSTPRVYDQTEFDDLDEFDGYDAYSGRDGFNLRPAPMRSVARPTGPAVRRIPRTDDTSPTARLNVRRPATPPRPAGSRQHTGSIPRVTEDAPPRASAPAATTPRDVTGGVRRPQVTEADVVHTGSGTRATLANGLQHVDPLLRRVGALALVIALCIPVALGLRSGGDTASTAPAPDRPATIATGTAPGAADGAVEVAASADAATEVNAVPTAAVAPAMRAAAVPDCAPQTVWELPWTWHCYSVVRARGRDGEERIVAALKQGIIDAEQAEVLRLYETLRQEVIQVADFAALPGTPSAATGND